MAVGCIDYDEDLSVQVFSPYQGKIITAFANLGEDVQKGQSLYTIDSPDLVQAESTLIGAAATDALTSKELARAAELSGTNAYAALEESGAALEAGMKEASGHVRFKSWPKAAKSMSPSPICSNLWVEQDGTQKHTIFIALGLFL